MSRETFIHLSIHTLCEGSQSSVSGCVLSDDQVGGDKTVQGTMGPCWMHQGRLPGRGREEQIPM